MVSSAKNAQKILMARACEIAEKPGSDRRKLIIGIARIFGSAADFGWLMARQAALRLR
jgi:hypothetical protein